MAITRPAFDEAQIPLLLSGALNDDLRISLESRRRGYPVCRRLSLQVQSPVKFTWNSFLEFGIRQYYQVKHYDTGVFVCVVVILWLYTVGFLTACVNAPRSEFALAALFMVMIFDQVRALGRRRLIASLYDTPTLKKLRPTIWVEHMFTPVWMAIHCMVVTCAIFARTITWGGVTYQAVGLQKILILARRSTVRTPASVTKKPIDLAD